MPAYLIVHLDVTDSDKFKEYGGQVPAIVEKYGGRYLVRGGRFEVLEGDQPQSRHVVLEFPSYEEAKAWYDSDDYAGPKALRREASRGDVMLIEGV